MNVRIIKRAEVGKKASATLPVKTVEIRISVAETINSWIDNLRRRRDEEQRAAQKILQESYSGMDSEAMF